MTDTDNSSAVNLVRIGLIVEGGLFCAALALGWFGFCDRTQPLALLDWKLWRYAAIWGSAATIPMLLFLIVLHFWTPPALEPMRRFVDTRLKPIFRGVSLSVLLILSIMAGFGEEIFFRWCLQGGITSTLETRLGLTAAASVGIVVASLIFGGCHWVNASYGITTTLVGAYLGLTMIWSGTWLVPAIAHALFDFIALIYIARMPANP